MPPHLTRGTLVSFDSSTYTALVMLAGSVAEVSMPVLETVPANYLAADDEVAVLLFQATNYENGVVLGPFGAVAAAPAFAGLNLGTATGAGPGDLRLSDDLRLTTNGAALEMVRSTGAAVIEVLRIAAGSDVLEINVPGSTLLALRVVNTGATSLLELTGAGALSLRVGPLDLPDGITAPGTLAGFARLYVDAADGDLKVRFGDGTIKTIVTDT